MKKITQEQLKTVIDAIIILELINGGGLHAEKLTQREMPSKNNKLVEGKIPLPSFCFDYQGKPLLALAFTDTDFSDDVFVSAVRRRIIME